MRFYNSDTGIEALSLYPTGAVAVANNLTVGGAATTTGTLTVGGAATTTGTLTVGNASTSATLLLNAQNSTSTAAQIGFQTGGSTRWTLVTGQGYTGVGAADSFNLYNNTIGTVHSVTAAGAHIIGNASAKGSHTVNGYLSANGAGTSGTASGEHPYLACKKITGTLDGSGLANVAHGLTADRIAYVTGKIYNGISGVWFSQFASGISFAFDNTNVNVIASSASGFYNQAVEVFVHYEP
jgi:hypothetical protein